jgi:hemoglobin
MAKMIITGTCCPSVPTRASLPFHIGKGAREAGYEVESRFTRNRMHRTIQRIAISVLMLAAIGPSMRIAAQTKAPAEQPKSLYDRLGGVYSIATVVDDFIERLLVNDTLNANPAISEARARVPKAGLKFHVTALVCEVTGGPCKYVGRTMKEAHAHLNITEAQWDAMVADFRKTLDKFKVPAKEQEELIAIVGSTKKDILKPTGTAQP